MSAQIRIDILHGTAFVQAADIDRAEAAALAAIEAAGCAVPAQISSRAPASGRSPMMESGGTG